MRLPRFRLRTVMIGIAFLALILTVIVQGVLLQRAAIREQLLRAQAEMQRAEAEMQRAQAEAGAATGSGQISAGSGHPQSNVEAGPKVMKGELAARRRKRASAGRSAVSLRKATWRYHMSESCMVFFRSGTCDLDAAARSLAGYRLTVTRNGDELSDRPAW